MRSKPSRVLVVCAFLFLLSIVASAVSISSSAPISQTFDGIGTTAAATLPTDFKVDRLSTSAASDVRRVGTFSTAVTATTQAGGANLGTSASNGIYNFGSGT